LAYFERGLAYLDIGRSDGAIADLTEVLKVRPNMKGALFFRGLAYNQSGNRVYGRRDIEKSAELGGNLAMKWLEEHPAKGWQR
jgi:Flp pilus assembly protein TadD